MSRKLSEMTLQELWELFPIILTPHNDNWVQWYFEEKQTLSSVLAGIHDIMIYHVGSTAVNGIWAKPIVDILIETPGLSALTESAARLEQAGYIRMSDSTHRVSLNKGYTENGFAERVFHIHLRISGDNDEVYFRNYLNSFPETAREYEALKLELWKKYEHNRDAYTAAKTDFVVKHTQRAKENIMFNTGL